jgi:transglutaminase-like putative cysteine protease
MLPNRLLGSAVLWTDEIESFFQQELVHGEGTHFWAEYYLEGYGWVPVDVTVAVTADWVYKATPDERHRFKEYYFVNLDPFRYNIQKDVDIPITPDPGNAVLFRSIVQTPKVVCDTCPEDLDLFLAHWTADVKKV